jgi:hypothetical protein
MRRSIFGPFGPTVLAGFLALVPSAGALAENTEFENASSDCSQIVPAGVAAETKNLNTVPDDGLGPDAAKGSNNRLVRQLLAARPNEDLIICIAGCFSGRDRVVYAQPIESPAAVKKLGSVWELPRSGSVQQDLSAIQPGDGAHAAAAAANAAPSSGAILNRGAAIPDQRAARNQPGQAPASGGATN